MNILALETSGTVLSVALAASEYWWELNINRGFKHGETLMPAVSRLLADAGLKPSELDLIACTAGPGSFTGLRIGMATAKGIARGAECPLKAVPTLPLLATGREHWPGIVAPVMDARKKRVYAAAFKNGKRILPDSDVDLDEFMESLPDDETVLVTGPDARIALGRPRVVLDPLYASGRAQQMISAARFAFDADGPDPSDMGPLYLRLSEAEEALVKE